MQSNHSKFLSRVKKRGDGDGFPMSSPQHPLLPWVSLVGKDEETHQLDISTHSSPGTLLPIYSLSGWYHRHDSTLKTHTGPRVKPHQNALCPPGSVHLQRTQKHQCSRNTNAHTCQTLAGHGRSVGEAHTEPRHLLPGGHGGLGGPQPVWGPMPESPEDLETNNLSLKPLSWGAPACPG